MCAKAEAAPPKRKKASTKRRSKTRRRPKKAAPTTAPETPARPEPMPPPPRVTRGPTRIDFDDRLVQGQTNQSGAVVLFARKSTGLRSMVDRRKSFRQRTLKTIFDR